MTIIGEVSEIPGGFTVEWRIKEFFSLSSEGFYSPLFSFAAISWLLRIYPNSTHTAGSIALYLRRETPGPPINLDYDLGLKDIDGKINPEVHFTHTFKLAQGYGEHELISRSQLLERKSKLVPSDILSVVCRIKYPTSPDSSSTIAAEKCSYCKSTLDAHEDLSAHQQKCMDKPVKCPDCSDVVALKDWYDHNCLKTGVEGTTTAEKCSYCKSNLDVHENLSSHQQKCMDKPIKCPECSDVVALKDWYNHQCQKTRAEATEKWSHDFKTIMLSGDLSDVLVKVKGDEFRLHRSILAARNPYFYSMFKNDMKEKSSGTVTIDDCEPDTFRSFIHFIYTGMVDKLSSENVCDLYEAADKYQEDQLKDECLHFMINTLSVDSFCDYFAMTLRHDEKELFQKGIELFTNKGNEIARSVKWQAFVQEHPIQANELFIKTLDHYIKLNSH